ncbi:MAG: hypothetical protein ACM3WU_10020 [Bacillota bacterium]
MRVLLALDPGYLCTRIAIVSEGSREVREAPAGADPFAAAEALARRRASVVVLPGGPPADLYPWHPRNVAITRAKAYCEESGIPLVVARPDGEAVLPPRARLSGFRGCLRQPTCYGVPEVLACETAARSIGVAPETAKIVVAYLGEEVSVSARQGGALVDSSDPVACEGPFGLTSCGTAPATAFVSYASSSAMAVPELRDRLKRRSGAFGLAGVNSLAELREELASGSEEARGAVEAMAYQVAKEIGRQLSAFSGKVDCVCLCGAATSISLLVQGIEDRVQKWTRLVVLRDDLVIRALELEGWRALSTK